MKPLARAAAVLAVAALLVPAAPGPALARHGNRSDTITMTVDDVSPSVPTPTTERSPLTVTLTLQNTTPEQIDGIRIDGERGYPIANQDVLDKLLANPTPPSSGLLIPSHPRLQPVDLAPNSSTDVTFQTTTSTTNDGKGLCLCSPGEIYPLFFSAHVTSNGVDQRLGVTAAYLPSFYAPPVARARVSWVWPLLERPHRLTDDTVFTDDELAGSVSPDGRLSRALDVVEQVGSHIPITLLIDPELLDELEVMASSSVPYTVMTSNGHTMAGTGQLAASTWLGRLHDILVGDPQVHVQLTAYADPDVEALSQRGLSWSYTMPAAMTARVSKALAGRPLDSALAWPATGAISHPTLAKLAGQGVNTLILNSKTVRTGSAPSEPGLARLGLRHRDIAAALTSPTIEKYVSDAVSNGGHGTGALSALLAQLAVQIIPDVQARPPIHTEHQVTLVAPRYIDTDVPAAVRAIEDTSSSIFARPISLSDAVGGSLLPTARSQLRRAPLSSAGQGPHTLAGATAASGMLPAIRSLLDTTNSAAAAFVASLPVAIQRAESSAWRPHTVVPQARRFTRLLTKTFHDITSGVRIVNPQHASYTFGSSKSPLPITVANELQYPVSIRIEVTTQGDVPGFHAKDLGKQTVEATEKRTFNIPSTVERSGRIQIEARLLTGTGLLLGQNPVEMTVRSTALGLIGVVITIVAGAVLGIALLWRLVRRVRQRRTAREQAPAPGSAPAPGVA